MEKILLKSKNDLKEAKKRFKGYSAQIDEEIEDNSYPMILISNYSEDIEFGNGYDFCAVSLFEFEGSVGVVY